MNYVNVRLLGGTKLDFKPVYIPATTISSIGGTKNVISSTGQTTYTFNSSSNLYTQTSTNSQTATGTITISNANNLGVTILCVAGGGAGGNGSGYPSAGGGAGEVNFSSYTLNGNVTLNIYNGSGGTGKNYNTSGYVVANNGYCSSVTGGPVNILCYGGGAGGCVIGGNGSLGVGRSGGSAGGNCPFDDTGPSTKIGTNLGNIGGRSTGGSGYYSGGGGGAGGVGGNPSGANGGLGGAGYTSTISGSSVVYATGGAGSNGSTGSGANSTIYGGGGGGGDSAAASYGGNGGNGVVIISFNTSSIVSQPDAVDPRLLLWFPLNTNTNNTVNKGFNGTYNNLVMGGTSSMVSAANPFGSTSYILQYNATGVGSYISGTIILSSSYTICVWIQNTNWNFGGANAAGPQAWYLNYSGTTTSAGYGVELFNNGVLISVGSSNGVGYSAFSVSGGPSGMTRADYPAGVTQTTLNNNTWYHCAVVTTNNVPSLYINGVYWGSWGTSYPITTNNNFYLGTPVVAGTSGSGIINFYDLRVYNFALNSTQVNNVYTNVTVS